MLMHTKGGYQPVASFFPAARRHLLKRTLLPGCNSSEERRPIHLEHSPIVIKQLLNRRFELGKRIKVSFRAPSKLNWHFWIGFCKSACWGPPSPPLEERAGERSPRGITANRRSPPCWLNIDE